MFSQFPQFWPFVSAPAVASAEAIAVAATTSPTVSESEPVLVEPTDALSPTSLRLSQLEQSLREAMKENSELKVNSDKLQKKLIKAHFETFALQNEVDELKQSVAKQTAQTDESKISQDKAFVELLEGSKELQERVEYLERQIKASEKESFIHRADLAELRTEIENLIMERDKSRDQVKWNYGVVQELSKMLVNQNVILLQMNTQIINLDNQRKDLESELLLAQKENSKVDTLEHIIARQNRRQAVLVDRIAELDTLLHQAQHPVSSKKPKRSLSIIKPEAKHTSTVSFEELTQKLHDKLDQFKDDRSHKPRGYNPNKLFAQPYRITPPTQHFQPLPRARK